MRSIKTHGPVRAEKVDSLLVDTALDTGAIVVTADIMISKDCGTEGVPVILFKGSR